jgi:hypothetical protein
LTPLSFRWSTINDLMAGSAAFADARHEQAYRAGMICSLSQRPDPEAAPHFELIASNLTHEQEQKLKGALG